MTKEGYWDSFKPTSKITGIVERSLGTRKGLTESWNTPREGMKGHHQSASGDEKILNPESLLAEET